jgi:cobalt-zinc-cadmium efflux system outer membrane protein
LVRILTLMTVLIFFVAWIFTGGSTAFAAEKLFDLRQAVEFSLQNNGELKALREEKKIREAGKIKAGLYPNPTIEMGGTTGKLTGRKSENSLSAGVSQEFLTAGKRGNRLQVAGKEIESFDRYADNLSRLLIEEVKSAFYNLLQAKKRMELSERSIALNSRLLDISKQRFDADDIPEYEVNLARIEVARSEERKTEAEHELYTIKIKLLTLMGIPNDQAANFRGSLEVKPLTKTLVELKRLAFAKRPDLKALEAEKAKGDAEIALAFSEQIPNITVGVEYQHERTAKDVAGEEIKSRDNIIGAKVSLPIPLFDQNQGGVKEAKARKGSAENRYTFSLLTIEREVESAFARLITADKSLLIYTRDIIPQLDENLKLIQEAYSLGEVDILNVIEEQKKFFEVNNGYLSALYNRQISLVKLETAVGVDFNIEFIEGKK